MFDRVKEGRVREAGNRSVGYGKPPARNDDTEACGKLIPRWPTIERQRALVGS
jgi:hypothetical protein